MTLEPPTIAAAMLAVALVAMSLLRLIRSISTP
jgi:hypothetical protein